MKKRKIIGIDFDDCLIDFCPALVKHYNLSLGTSYTKDDVVSFGFHEWWGCTPEEAVKRCVDYYSHSDHINILPVKGAVEAVAKISKENDLIIITGRPESHGDSVYKWIEKYLPGYFKNIFFTNHYSGDNKTSKLEICKRNNVEIFVDDHIGFIEDIAGEGIQTFLIDAPWNQGEIHPSVIRVNSWDEIISKLEDCG